MSAPGDLLHFAYILGSRTGQVNTVEAYVKKKFHDESSALVGPFQARPHSPLVGLHRRPVGPFRLFGNDQPFPAVTLKQIGATGQLTVYRYCHITTTPGPIAVCRALRLQETCMKQRMLHAWPLITPLDGAHFQRVI